MYLVLAHIAKIQYVVIGVSALELFILFRTEINNHMLCPPFNAERIGLYANQARRNPGAGVPKYHINLMGSRITLCF